MKKCIGYKSIETQIFSLLKKYIIYYVYWMKKKVFSIWECPRMSLNEGLCQT